MLRRGGVLCCVLRAASAVVRECRRFACKAEVLRQEIDEYGVPCRAQVTPCDQWRNRSWRGELDFP